MDKKCILCDIPLQEQKFKDLKIIDGSPVLRETEHFYLTFDLHPISDCHYLIIPKEHITSYSLIPTDYQPELDALLQLTKEKSGVEHFILFEHGSGIVKNHLVGCGNSVFHAHLHFIGDLKYDLSEILKVISDHGIMPKELFMKTIQPKENLLHKISLATEDQKCLHSPYLFVKFNDTDFFIMPEREEVRIKSQFFRQVFAEELNGTGAFWDWKKGISHVDQLKNKERISKMLANFGIKQTERKL